VRSPYARGCQEGSHTRESGNDLPEQLQAFGDQLRAEKGRPGDISTRPCQAGDQLVADGIGHHRRDDGERVGGLLGGTGCGRAPRDNDVNLERHQLGRELGKPIRLPLRIPALEGQVLPLDVSELVQALVEWLENGCRMRSGAGHQEAYPGHLPGLANRLLRASRERPSSRAAEECDECAAPHLVTSSAESAAFIPTSS